MSRGSVQVKLGLPGWQIIDDDDVWLSRGFNQDLRDPSKKPTVSSDTSPAFRSWFNGGNEFDVSHWLESDPQLAQYYGFFRQPTPRPASQQSGLTDSDTQSIAESTSVLSEPDFPPPAFETLGFDTESNSTEPSEDLDTTSTWGSDFSDEPLPTREPLQRGNLWNVSAGEQNMLAITDAAAEATSALIPDGKKSEKRSAIPGKKGGNLSESGTGYGGLFVGLGNVAGSTISGAMGLGAASMRDSTEKQMQASRQTFTTSNEAQMQSYFVTNQAQTQTNLLQSQNNMTSNQIALQNNSYNNWLQQYDTVTGNETAALAQAGLPSYLAYLPGGSALAVQPRTTQLTPGGTTYTAKLPGNPSSVPYNGSVTQVKAGYGAM